MGQFTLNDTLWITFLTFSFTQLFLPIGFKSSLIVSVFVLSNIIVLFFWFSLPSCSKEAVDTFMNGLKVAAHRGGAEDAPENTMGAFRQAIEMGVDAIELDLSFTSDNIAVAFHDETMDRVTDGSGTLELLSWEFVQKLNAAHKFKDRVKFHHERIPTFEEVLELCMEHRVRIFIDVKSPHPMAIPTILSMFHKHPMLYEIAAVCSFFPHVTYETKRQDNNIITGHTWRPGFFSYADIARTIPRYQEPWKHAGALAFDFVYKHFLHSWLWKISGADLFLACRNVISPVYVEEWWDRGLRVVAWTVDDYHEKLHLSLEMGIPIITDRLSDISTNVPNVS